MFAEFHDNWHTTNNKELTKTVNFVGWVYCDSRHFQQYFSYIVAVIFIGGGNVVPGENYRPATSH
jgi:hypothetical protein